MKPFIVALMSIAFCGQVLADVKLVVKDFRGQSSTISSNGEKARIESGQMPGYAIVDYSSGEFLMVNPERGEVVRMSVDDQDASIGAAGLDVSLKDRGGGQKIAGYLTRKYEIIAEGESCGTVYASKKLLQNGSVNAMFDSMRAMQGLVGKISGGMSGLLSVCQRASLYVGNAMGSAGAPMKLLDAEGNLLSEVVSVDSDTKVSAGYYEIPAGMKVVSMDQMMNQAIQQMQNMPDMNQLLQQSGGRMTPEMKQQLEQLQKMMEQMQQQ